MEEYEEQEYDDYQYEDQTDEYDEYNEYNDDDDIDNYKSPTDEDFQDLERNDDIDEQEDIMEDDSVIDTGAEWRDFADGGPSKSRVGMARAMDIEEDLGTMINDDRYKKLDRMTKTPEDIFRSIAMDVSLRYKLTKDNYEDGLRIMQLINKHDRKLKYKSPKAIMFAILVFTGDKIDKTKLEKIYKDKASHENMSKIDLLRYAFFIQTLRKL